MDDIIVTGSSYFKIENFLSGLQSSFHVRNLGNLSYFLGIRAACDHDGLHLRQSNYISDLLEKTLMVGARPLASPTVSGSNFQFMTVSY